MGKRPPEWQGCAGDPLPLVSELDS